MCMRGWFFHINFFWFCYWRSAWLYCSWRKPFSHAAANTATARLLSLCQRRCRPCEIAIVIPGRWSSPVRDAHGESHASDPMTLMGVRSTGLAKRPATAYLAAHENACRSFRCPSRCRAAPVRGCAVSFGPHAFKVAATKPTASSSRTAATPISALSPLSLRDFNKSGFCCCAGPTTSATTPPVRLALNRRHVPRFGTALTEASISFRH